MSFSTQRSGLRLMGSGRSGLVFTLARSLVATKIHPPMAWIALRPARRRWRERSPTLPRSATTFGTRARLPLMALATNLWMAHPMYSQLPSTKTTAQCINHGDRPAVRTNPLGQPICAWCHYRDLIQAPITKDEAAIRRAEQAGALDPHEALVIRRRGERR